MRHPPPTCTVRFLWRKVVSETALGLTAVVGSALLLAISAAITCAAVAEFAPECSLARSLTYMARLLCKIQR